jgi:hypothetical protein
MTEENVEQVMNSTSLSGIAFNPLTLMLSFQMQQVALWKKMMGF